MNTKEMKDRLKETERLFNVEKQGSTIDTVMSAGFGLALIVSAIILMVQG